ncbi:MAG: response regulator [Bacteroidota bacterium]
MIQDNTNTKTKIFLIEDNELYSQGLTYMLSDSNFDVTPVYSAEEAYQMLFSTMPDIIILDVILSQNIDGFSFLNVIKNDIRVAHIPVIVISSMSLNDKITQALTLGASDYLVKPFKVDDLVIKINSLIQLRDNIIRHISSRSVISQISEMDSHHKLITEFTLHVQELIAENKDASIPEIVKSLGVGYAKLEEIVKKVFDMTPITYILTKRLEKADLMLRNSNMSINDIANSAGFHSASYFCTSYKKAFGITPLQNRKNSNNH